MPIRGNLQSIRQGRPLHLFAEDLIQGRQPRLQLPLQAQLLAMLLLELFMGVDRLRQLLGQLAIGRPRQLQLTTQGIEGRLQIVGLCTEGASTFIFQLEARQPGLGL